MTPLDRREKQMVEEMEEEQGTICPTCHHHCGACWIAGRMVSLYCPYCKKEFEVRKEI